jgi:hypothetical protein
MMYQQAASLLKLNRHMAVSEFERPLRSRFRIEAVANL